MTMIARTTSLELALRLESDKLADIDRTLRRVRDSFDGGEDAAGSFRIECDPWCPALRAASRTTACACGRVQATDDLIAACELMTQAREGIAKCVEAVAGAGINNEVALRHTGTSEPAVSGPRNPCACGKYECGTRLFQDRTPSETHWGEYCEIAGVLFRKGEYARRTE